MSLIETLRTLGCSLHLLAPSECGAAPAAPSASSGPAAPVASSGASSSSGVASPTKIPTRSVTLADLAREYAAANHAAAAGPAAEFDTSFDAILARSGLPLLPPNWTLERVATLLSTEPYKSMDRITAGQMVSGLMVREGLTVEALAREIVRRDHALDEFEHRLTQAVAERRRVRENRLYEIESAVRALEAERKKLETDRDDDATRFSAWKSSKRALEAELARVIGYFLKDPVVTQDQEPRS